MVAARSRDVLGQHLRNGVTGSRVGTKLSFPRWQDETDPRAMARPESKDMAPFRRTTLPAHLKSSRGGRPSEYRPEYCQAVIDAHGVCWVDLGGQGYGLRVDQVYPQVSYAVA